MRRWIAANFLWVLLLWTSGLPAQPGPDRDRALELGRKGVELYNQGRWAEAHERFARANSLVPSPVFVLYLARTKRNSGDLVSAYDFYRQLDEMPVGEDAPEPWQGAQQDGREELALLKRELPSIRLVLTGPDAQQASVSLDAKPVAPASLAQPIFVNPGRHVLVVERPYKEPLRREVQVAQGEGNVVVRVDMTPLAVPAPSTAGASAPEELDSNTGATMAMVGAVFLGGGLVVAAGGGVLGVAALVFENQSEGSVPGMGEAGIALLISGGVLTATGIVLMVVGNSYHTSSDPDEAEPQVALQLGAGTLVLTGSF